MTYPTWTDLITAMKAATVTADVQTISTNMKSDMSSAGISAGSVAAVNQWLDEILVTNSFNKNFKLLNNAGSLFVYFMNLTPPVAPNEVNANLLVIGTLTVSPNAATSGAITTVAINNAANTGQTASTEIPSNLITTASRQWATGAITIQREVYITAPTYSFVGASIITNAYTFYAPAPIAGANATITNNWAAGFGGNVEIKSGTPNLTINATDATSFAALTMAAASGTSATTFFQSGSGTVSSGLYIKNSLWVQTFSESMLFNNGLTAGAMVFAIGGTAASNEVFRMNPIATSGALSSYVFTKPNTTGQTLSTEVNGILFTTGTRQWATGAITTQREFNITSPTYSFVGASTIINAYGFAVAAPTAGTNATITNNYAAGFTGSVGLTGTLNIGSITTLPLTTWINIAAGTTGKSQINLAASTAPTSPVNGDIWFDGTNIKIQVGGATKTFTIV